MHKINASFAKTRLKVNSALDREPKNYSNVSSFSNHSNFAEVLQFFPVFINLIGTPNQLFFNWGQKMALRVAYVVIC